MLAVFVEDIPRQPYIVLPAFAVFVVEDLEMSANVAGPGPCIVVVVAAVCSEMAAGAGVVEGCSTKHRVGI